MKSKKIIYISYLAILITLFIIFTIFTLAGKLSSFDTAVYNEINSLNCDTLFKIITELGDVWVILPISIIGAIFIKKKKFLVTIFCALIGILLFNNLLKVCILRPRPMDLAIVEEAGFSYPSSHSAVSACFYLTIAACLLKESNSKWQKTLTLILLPIIIISIGVSRIYLGVHYATDVIAGISFGTIYFLLNEMLVNSKFVTKLLKMDS